MRHTRTITAVIGASLLIGVTAIPDSASAHGWRDHHDEPDVEVLISENLSSPKGLAVTRERDLAVGQGAFGAPGPVLVYDLHGHDAGTITPVTEPANLMDVAISPKDGTGWAIDGNTGDLLHQLADGTVVPVINIPSYQAGDPDPYNQADDPAESNPYGLTVARNGDALIVDAANNDLIRVTPEGAPTTMARFDFETLSTDNVPPDPEAPLPPFINAEAVPTTVTVGPDGYIYVGELKGFPFRVGSSHIWRIKPNAVGALCSVNTHDRACKVYKSGFTAIQDIAFDRWGTLYVYELAADGVFAFEGGQAAGATPPAVLLKVWGWGWFERRTELAAGQLNQPGGVVVTGNDVYVTDGVFSVGRLLKVNTH